MAVLIGFISGASSAALVASISGRLISSEALTTVFILYFASLVLLMLLSTLLARWLLIRLTTRISFWVST